jgi:hypothetical protein
MGSRIASLYAGLPETTPVMTVNRQCSSGLQAFANVAGGTCVSGRLSRLCPTPRGCCRDVDVSHPVVCAHTMRSDRRRRDGRGDRCGRGVDVAE